MKKILRDFLIIVILPSLLLLSGCAFLVLFMGDRAVFTEIETINFSSKNLKVFILDHNNKEEEFKINSGQSFKIKRVSGLNIVTRTPYEFIDKIIISDENSNKLIVFSGIDINNMKFFRCVHDQFYIFEITDALLESKDDYYKFSVGNISLIVPNDYAVSYGIEGKIIKLDNLKTNGDGYNKSFSINIFRKDGNYKPSSEYGISILPALIDYLRPSSLPSIYQKKPKEEPDLNVAAMKRSTFEGINACETLTLGRFTVADVIFEHQIIFIDDEYCYIMKTIFWGNDFVKEMRLNLPGFFDENGWIADKQAAIYDRFINARVFMPDYIWNLCRESINIFYTMTFIE